MSIQAVLLPVLTEIALIFALLVLTAQARMRAFQSGLSRAEVALSDGGFPPRARQIANCYANQFEMPVLFFLAAIFGVVLHRTGIVFVLCEWVFVACRLGHALVHITSNDLRLRGPLFLGSALAAGLMWALIFVGVFFGTALV